MIKAKATKEVNSGASDTDTPRNFAIAIVSGQGIINSGPLHLFKFLAVG
jgi:hypothetical protein